MKFCRSERLTLLDADSCIFPDIPLYLIDKYQVSYGYTRSLMDEVDRADRSSRNFTVSWNVFTKITPDSAGEWITTTIWDNSIKSGMKVGLGIRMQNDSAKNSCCLQYDQLC